MSTVPKREGDSGVDISPRKIRYWVRDTESPVRILRSSVSLSELGNVTSAVIMKTKITGVDTTLRIGDSMDIAGAEHGEPTLRRTLGWESTSVERQQHQSFSDL